LARQGLCSTDDVKAIAVRRLAHRILLRPELWGWKNHRPSP